VELDAAMTGFKEKRKVPLNSGDSIYQGVCFIRNIHFHNEGENTKNNTKQKKKNDRFVIQIFLLLDHF